LVPQEARMASANAKRAGVRIGRWRKIIQCA
jgi:hypothetical protein